MGTISRVPDVLSGLASLVGIRRITMHLCKGLGRITSKEKGSGARIGSGPRPHPPVKPLRRVDVSHQLTGFVNADRYMKDSGLPRILSGNFEKVSVRKTK